MSRAEFEISFFNPANSRVRRAFLMQALAKGPDWKQWAAGGKTQTSPAIYNDLLFCACYGFYKQVPTRNRSIQMRDFLWARNAKDAGFLINPFFQGSDERKMTGNKMVALSSEHKKLEDAAQPVAQLNNAASLKKVYIADGASTNDYMYVYSEMFMPNGSMRGFLGSADEKQALATLGANAAVVQSSTVALGWIDALVKKFSGTTGFSERYGKTFDSDDLGLTGDDKPETKWKIGRTPILIGNRR